MVTYLLQDGDFNCSQRVGSLSAFISWVPVICTPLKICLKVIAVSLPQVSSNQATTAVASGSDVVGAARVTTDFYWWHPIFSLMQR